MSLQKKIEEFKNIPFPDDSSTNEELSDIFSELVSYDMFIAGNVDSILAGHKSIELEYDMILEEKVKDFLNKENVDDTERKTALKIKRYIDEINSLINEVNKYLNK